MKTKLTSAKMATVYLGLNELKQVQALVYKHKREANTLVL